METDSYRYTSQLHANPASKSGRAQKVRNFERRIAKGLKKADIDFVRSEMERHGISEDGFVIAKGEVWVKGTEFYIDKTGNNFWIPERSSESITNHEAQVLANACEGRRTMTPAEIKEDAAKKAERRSRDAALGDRAGAVAASEELASALRGLLAEKGGSPQKPVLSVQ